MPNQVSLSEQIDTIGVGMVTCSFCCDGIRLDPSKGILPRSLVLEDQDRKGARGSVALGINPGIGDDKEESFYLEHRNTYDAMLEFWRMYRCLTHPYHIRLRRFIDFIGLEGPILWTELVKCQNLNGIKAVPPLSTLRTCVHLYLVHEISAVPASWPIIAIGKEPFKIAALMFPSRTIIGVPHPTGSYGLFPALFDKTDKLAPHSMHLVNDALTSKMPVAIWLAERKSAKNTAQ